MQDFMHAHVGAVYQKKKKVKFLQHRKS